MQVNNLRRRAVSIVLALALATTLASFFAFNFVSAKTEDGCKTESKDYLIDLEAMSGEDLIPGPLTVYGFFGSCCVGNYYEDPENNKFPSIDCCRPPDTEIGKHCGCAMDYHETKEKKIHGQLVELQVDGLELPIYAGYGEYWISLPGAWSVNE